MVPVQIGHIPKHGEARPEAGDSSIDQKRLAALEVLGAEVVTRLDHAAYLMEELDTLASSANVFSLSKPNELNLYFLNPQQRRQLETMVSPRRRNKPAPIKSVCGFDAETLVMSEKRGMEYCLNVAHGVKRAQVELGLDPETPQQEPSGDEAKTGSQTIAQVIDKARKLELVAEDLPTVAGVKTARVLFELVRAKIPNQRRTSVEPTAQGRAVLYYTVTDLVENCADMERVTEACYKEGKKRYDEQRAEARIAGIDTAVYLMSEVDNITNSFVSIFDTDRVLGANEMTATAAYLEEIVAKGAELLRRSAQHKLDDPAVSSVLSKFRSYHEKCLKLTEQSPDVQHKAAPLLRDAKIARDTLKGGHRLIEPKKEPELMAAVEKLTHITTHKEKVFSFEEVGLMVAIVKGHFETFYRTWQLAQTGPTDEVTEHVWRTRTDTHRALKEFDLLQAIDKIKGCLIGNEAYEIIQALGNDEHHRKIEATVFNSQLSAEITAVA